uniref:Uncharacterized protein n=1 Tax=Avena sativa TaxID=4498 RepID=A0ACD5YM01_AVESA
MSKDTSSKQSLGDIILQKIREKDATVSTEGRPAPKLDTRIVELYKEVGQLLRRYTSGKIPKALKRIPSLECWADVLQLTQPEHWSPNAVYQATRLFSSNMSAKNAVRFYEAILLPRIRNDIKHNKRLHFALYQAMKKSLYKPAAFFKGILLPICQEGDCTLREAVIIGSILEKCTIPPLHASVALMKLADMEYCGTTSYFIKIFLERNMLCRIVYLMQFLPISCGFLTMRGTCLLYGTSRCSPLWKDTRMSWRRKIRRNLHACWITRNIIWLLQKFAGNFEVAQTGVKRRPICRSVHLFR